MEILQLTAKQSLLNEDVLFNLFLFPSMAPWCPACRGFVETWDKFSDWSKDLDIKVGVVDVTENPGQYLIVVYQV